MIKLKKPSTKVKFLDQPPLNITKQARQKLSAVRLENNIPAECVLRIKSRLNIMADILDFDMFFYKVIEKTDALYKCGNIEFVLDCETAYNLIGSDLDVGDDGEFKFDHPDYINTLDYVDTSTIN